MKRKKIIIIFSILLLSIFGLFISYSSKNKELNIDKVLETKSYRYLSSNVKEFIKDYYEKTGQILLTEDDAKTGDIYLNPNFIEYLDSDDKESYEIIPSETAYIPLLKSSNEIYPAKYDLRDVDGKNFVTPNKEQKEGICWAYATASLLATHDLILNNKSYDENALQFSEKQMDYAISPDGIIGGNKVGTIGFHELGDGAQLSDVSKLLAKYLGSASVTWDSVNQNAVSINEKLAPEVVFNRNNFKYEVDETVEIKGLGPELNENQIAYLKEYTYNYGGMVIGTCSDNYIKNGLNLSESLGICTNRKAYHALHLIGWDDNYEYSYCRIESDNKYSYKSPDTNGECSEGEKIIGEGTWILKNSWGSNHAFIYMPYNTSYFGEILAITKYSDGKSWSNAYELSKNTLNNEYEISTDFAGNEKIVKIKLKLLASESNEIYFSESGNLQDYISIGTFNVSHGGYYTIDLSNSNISINTNSKFKLSNETINVNRIIVFTDNVDEEVIAKTDDFRHTVDNEVPTSGNYLDIAINTQVRGLADGEKLEYKIKSSNDEYLPDNAYIITMNGAYYNLVTPIIKLKEEYAKKGNYTLETWFDNRLLDTSSLVIDNDYIGFKGSGTYDDPWQIENTRQFNMIKNAIYDNYILMNDLDFEYDTQNSNGLFYNNGDGWQAINFRGNFNGNGKTIKNIKTDTGLFDRVMFSSNSKCNKNECGIHDLNVDNIIFSYQSAYSKNNTIGGIINEIIIDKNNTYKFNFSNLSVTNFKINNGTSYFGGIVGSIGLKTDYYGIALKMDNWYSDMIVNSAKNDIGGVVGSLSVDGQYAHVSFNNIKSNIHFNNLNVDNTTTVSDIINTIYVKNNAHITLNNIIGNFIYNPENYNNFIPKALVYDISGASDNVRINGAKSTLEYTSNDLITTENCEFGVKPYEFSTKDYSGFEYYEYGSYVYNTESDKTKKVTFADRFTMLEPTIPVLKRYNETYSNFYKQYVIKVGETKTANDLIAKNANHHKISLYNNFECNLDICTNVTDDTIISLITENDNYSFTGLKKGTTTLILYDEVSGYLDAINIKVIGDDEHKLILNANYSNGVNQIITIHTNEMYGELPIPKRGGHAFTGWYTEQNGGIKINSDTVYEGNIDQTLYAHWEETNHIILLDKNGGTGGTDQIVLGQGENLVLPTVTKEGYVLKNWTFNEVALNENIDFSEYDQVTIVANWMDISGPSIMFEPNGGNDTYIKETSINVTIIDNGSGLEKNQYVNYWWQENPICSIDDDNIEYRKTIYFNSVNGVSGVKIATNSIFASSLNGEQYLCISGEIKDADGNVTTVTQSKKYIFDHNSPTISEITGGTALKAINQTVTLKCNDDIGLSEYFFGTDLNSSNNNYSELQALASDKGLSKTITEAGTYYFTCKDVAGNYSPRKTIKIVNYTVNNLIQKETGTKDEYNNLNYEIDTSSTYIIKNGTILPLNSIYSLPNLAVDNSNFRGYSLVFSSSTISLLNNNPTVSSGANYYVWFNRQIQNYVVTFDSDGGSTVSSQIIAEGNKVIKPTNPTKYGYTFVEWQLNNNKYDFNTVVTDNITLKALWQETSTDFLLGDMNQNGKIDLADIILLLKVYLNDNVTFEDIRIGDMDNNGSIGLKDIILLLKTYLDI